MRLAAFHSTGYLHWMMIGFAVLGLLVPTSAPAQESSVACKLLQPAELESALGGKAGKFSGVGVGYADICRGQIGRLKVLIRTAKRQRGDGGAVEREGIEMARKMGVHVEIKTEGDLTCSTFIPPASAVQMGFNTTCSILRAGRVVAVEVAAPSQKEMASTDAVRKLVQKAVSRSMSSGQ